MKERRRNAKLRAAIAGGGAGNLFRELGILLRALVASPERKKLLLLVIGIFIVVGATAYGQIELNAWNRPFYDALASRSLSKFFQQGLVFLTIAGGLLVLNVGQMRLNQLMRLKLRESLVHDLLGIWLHPRRAFRLALGSEVGQNPDQRLHEDARHLTELSTDLGIGLLQSTILLLSFILVLWNLSARVEIPVFGYDIPIPGYMVWAALFYAAAASWLSWWVGRPLVRLNAERYGREAEFRSALVRVSEHIDAITLNGGEAAERRRFNRDLDVVLQATRRIVTGVTRLTWVTAGYGWFTLIAPFLVAAPVYFTGNLSLGGLMMAVGAFIQVQQALRWFVDNFSTIADWRATLFRIVAFRVAADGIDTVQEHGHRIKFHLAEPGRMTFDDLHIETEGGSTELSEAHVEIRGGEHVLIAGERGSGKTLLLRTISGIYTTGSGRIGLPRGESVMYVPHAPYVPRGTLREAVAYPSPPTAFAEERITGALDRVGLGYLIPSLPKIGRWDRDLSDEEQQRLGFARILLRRPQWIIIDEALERLEDESRERLADAFSHELSRSTVIHIGRPQSKNLFFNRQLHLVRTPTGRKPAEAEKSRSDHRHVHPAAAAN